MQEVLGMLLCPRVPGQVICDIHDGGIGVREMADVVG